MIVFVLAKDGSIRNFMNKNLKAFTVAKGLTSLHENNLLHRDFHIGNSQSVVTISDLGLCLKNIQKEKKDIYGVFPYVAPELLKEKEYSKASDIYSFGIIMIEILFEEPPYNDQAMVPNLHIKFIKVKDLKFQEKPFGFLKN